MFKVLIVEDEVLVSIGIKNMIDWARFDMCVIGEAQNGKEAYEVYQREKPNLVITDIKMPVMDGLQFISKIRENDKQTKIIILTCYDEFDLVYNALKLGVSDYILKFKMSPKDIEPVLQKVYSEMQNAIGAQLVNHEPYIDSAFIREKVIKDYILYQTCSDVDFISLVKKMNLRITPNRLVFCIMKLDNYERILGKFDAKHEQTVHMAILNLIDDLFQKYGRGEIVHEKEERYWLLFSFTEIVSEKSAQVLISEILERIDVIMKNYINSTVSFGISGFYNQYSSLGKMYKEASYAIEQSYFLHDVKYLRHNENYKELFLSTIGIFHKFVENLDGLPSGYKKEILSGMGYLVQMYRKPKIEIQELFIHWVHLLSANASDPMDGVLHNALVFAKCIRESPTLSVAIDVFEQHLLTAIRCRNQEKLMSREVAEAVQFIKDNYYKEISLQQVAQKVEMSTCYFSSLFKKELKVSLVEYVNLVRIEKAKELLLNTHMKTFEIAQKVGFTDESYFSRIFKKITGFRPNEFKKQQMFVAEGVQETDNVS